jgi:di/tricarboxylate transporter
MFLKKHKIDLVEIVIADNSWLINRTLRTANFRAKYDATAIAIHRNGEQIQGQLSDIKLKPGDAILILAGEKFWALTQNTKDFYIISKLKEIRKLGFWRSLILVGGTLLVILLSALKIISLFLGLIVLLIVFTSVKITTPQKLGEKIDYDLGFLIVMALAFGKAMIKSNSADLIANFLIDIFKPLGTMGILVGLFIITALIASFITNKAAVAILFPISLTIAKELSIPPQAAVLTMAYASTANFLTPIGYQTNTMVYGAGGYKFRDFFKVGGILTIIYCIVTVTMVKLLYM